MEIRQRNINNKDFTTDKYTFCHVEIFTYSETEIVMTNKETAETISCIQKYTNLHDTMDIS